MAGRVHRWRNCAWHHYQADNGHWCNGLHPNRSLGRIKGDGMNEQETKNEIAQAKKDLLDARAKLKELSAKLKEISDVVEKIEAVQSRLQKVEEKLFLEEFSKKSYFHPIGNGKE
jgi:hypothetical protein